MKKLLALTFAGISMATAATTVTFQEVPMSCCPPVTTEWAAYGITMSDVYWYSDGRDTFDQVGISIDRAPGQVSFTSVASSLRMDYLVLGGHTGTYRVYDAGNNLLDQLIVAATGGHLLGSYLHLRSHQHRASRA
ncbi:MAG: hypothetical protein FJW40_08575 [Acidobacteria bacterium]|nr:hypothetical protein [Acidobacteriota bacterium]